MDASDVAIQWEYIEIEIVFGSFLYILYGCIIQ